LMSSTRHRSSRSRSRLAARSAARPGNAMSRSAT
jgi:hypothetical protein